MLAALDGTGELNTVGVGGVRGAGEWVAAAAVDAEVPRAERLPSEAVPDAPDAGAVGVRSTFDRAERLVLAGPKPPEGGIGGGGVPSQVGS